MASSDKRKRGVSPMLPLNRNQNVENDIGVTPTPLSTRSSNQYTIHFQMGDNSIDLPDVNVIIQISSQRLGRILRPKSRETGRFNAFFYTLVSSATKRQRFLVDQEYSFEVVNKNSDMDEMKDLKYTTKKDQMDLLRQVIAVDAKQGCEEKLDDPWDVLAEEKKKKKKKKKVDKVADQTKIVNKTKAKRDSTKGVRNMMFTRRENHQKKVRREIRADAKKGGSGGS